MAEVKQRGTRGSGETGAQKGVHGCDDKQSGQEREGKWAYAPLVQVTGLFVVVRLAQYILVGLTPGAGFDNSTQLLLDIYVSADAQARFFHRHVLNKLLPWDSVFFIKGMMSTDVLPEYEHEFAFSITWTWTVKQVYRVLCRLCGVSETPDFYCMLKVAIALENVLYYISTLVLYHLTFLVFSPTASTTHNHYASRLAKTTAVLFVFTSAAGFTLGIYSEPLSSCFTFVGMVCREYACRDLSADAKRFHHPARSFLLYTFATTACFTIAMLNRSNCVLLGLFYLYDLWRFALAQSFALALWQPLLSGLAMLTALVVQQYYIPFQHFCVGSTPSEWCADRWFSAGALAFLTRSSLYSYIQSHYWHVGFLSYWTPNNIPNFLFALPNLVVMAYASFYFSWIYPQSRLRPKVLVTVAFVAAMLLFANVQIINRLATSVPLHLWYLADRLVKGGAHSGSDRGDDRLVKYYLCWLVAWIPAQTILFAAFLPPA
ncbi:GPI-anchor transamidase [Maudiozyma humilis]|uniref:GPI mannosyltransferase 2 n=1 Tax=Maudiozyma humilis TaxID=51915 RepID=A0AAV5S314_MAUHU|nr:hypothetical protein DAKH74_046460 [Kazachstania humilis]GMM58240.1 GPI-anchor transamidase [Kazachstania humilis]